ncbi:MAG: metallophosphoesterase [Methanosarcinaceae archaeon]|nr:metallophosphoesterase [Methanosarcinaceae archaeon]
MKILAISDAHGDCSCIASILKEAGDIDLVLIAGDLTDFGPEEKAVELINIFNKPVMAVPGNCDMRSILGTMDISKATNLHNNSKCIGDITFIGLGGSNPTPFNTAFELEENEIESNLERLLKEVEVSGNTIVLLTHAPPFGTVDKIPIGHVGSTAIRKFVGKVDLIVCGHIHEARGVMKIGKTVVVNTGMACEGHGALITIDKNGEATQIDVKLIDA